jgi:hypothetical protein
MSSNHHQRPRPTEALGRVSTDLSDLFTPIFGRLDSLDSQIAALHAALKLHPPQAKHGGSDDMTVAHDQLDDAQRNLTRRISERVQEQASAVFVHVVEPLLERLTRIEDKLDNALSRISVLEASLPRRREGEYE